MGSPFILISFITILQGKAQENNGTTSQLWEGIMNFLANMDIVETIQILKTRGVEK